MWIKTTMRYHLTPVRMAIINTATNNKYWRRCGVKTTHVHCWWGCRLVQPLWKAVWSYLKKLKMELPYNPVIPLLGIYLKKPEILIYKKICTFMFIASLFIIGRIWKQPKCPSVDEWLKKLWYIYAMEYYSAIKKMETLPLQQHEWTWTVLC